MNRQFSNLGSFHGLFVHACHLVCHRLISSWKADLNTSLAALELLSALARIRVTDHGNAHFSLALNGILMDV